MLKLRLFSVEKLDEVSRRQLTLETPRLPSQCIFE